MMKADTSQIDQPWTDIEAVAKCPYCRSRSRRLAFDDVQDWVFYSAPGKWTYWDCLDCHALFVDPRPTEDSIGRAYQRYYTHVGGFVQGLKKRVINEILSRSLEVSVKPRLHLPHVFAGLLRPFEAKVGAPFEIRVLASMPKGRLMDIGCGDGGTVYLAHLLGWDAMGIDMDHGAVRAAKRKGLNVETGSYQKLAEHEGVFDYIICSHVIEHVYNPLDLLRLIFDALKESGVALLSCPNSTSFVRYRYGQSWRGLEAPRHLAIPAFDFLRLETERLGFKVDELPPDGANTTAASQMIEAQRVLLGRSTGLPQVRSQSEIAHPDFIQLFCRKLPHGKWQNEAIGKLCIGSHG